MQVNLRGKRVGVEKIKSQKPGAAHSGIVMPDSEEYFGIIRYVGSDADPILKVGQRVYFSTSFQQCMIAGAKICIMNDTEIFGTVE
jgi:co-chaperonin GroES (HSP10)